LPSAFTNIVHRHGWDFADRDLGAPQDVPDLRPVAVRDHDVPAALDHRRDVDGKPLHHLVLAGDRLVIRIADERIAADRDDG
jgi:hypothetical protein